MGWTKPRLLAYGNEWFDASLDHKGPAYYEIGTAGPRGGNIEWHYVGETANEKKRMSCYGRDGSHIPADQVASKAGTIASRHLYLIDMDAAAAAAQTGNGQ